MCLFENRVQRYKKYCEYASVLCLFVDIYANSSVAINFRQKPIKTLLNAFELRSTRTLPQKTPCVQAPR